MGCRPSDWNQTPPEALALGVLTGLIMKQRATRTDFNATSNWWNWNLLNFGIRSPFVYISVHPCLWHTIMCRLPGEQEASPTAKWSQQRAHLTQMPPLLDQTRKGHSPYSICLVKSCTMQLWWPLSYPLNTSKGNEASAREPRSVSDMHRMSEITIE